MSILSYNIKQGIVPGKESPGLQSYLIGGFNGIALEGGVVVSTSCYSYVVVVTPTPRDPTLDIILDCRTTFGGVSNYGVLKIATSLSGEWISKTIQAIPITASSSIYGYCVQSLIFNGLLELNLYLKPSSAVSTPGVEPSFFVPVTTPSKANWIKWSDIGNLNFTITKSNVAGERPLDWSGHCYHIKKLGSKVVIYGQNGVTLLIPASVQGAQATWGMQTVQRLGIRNIGAIAGTESIHFFIDTEDYLCSLDESSGIQRIGYQEYLCNMGTVVLSWDDANHLLYICDNATGYVYNFASSSLGKGPANVTGIGVQNKVSYVVSPTSIVIPTFEICSDIYDFGTRKPKTIQSIDIGTNLVGSLYTLVEYRVKHNSDFKQTEWFLVNPDGRSYPKCYGVEFRFRVKAIAYEHFELDYLNVKGFINNYSYTDSR
jgi:hypothetical protein